MDMNSEWMKHQLGLLGGANLLRSKWVHEEWNHAHCELCMDTIDASTCLAYCTEDFKKWVCEGCYQDFKETFGWVLLEKPEGTKEHKEVEK